MKTFFHTLLAAMALAFLPAEMNAGTFKESWYMSRGRANMQIRNYGAAIEAFEKLVEIDAGNREAMRLLGLAYESQGLTDKAIEHYDRHLKRFPDDAEIAFKQAQYLEGARFSYRRHDAVRYYRMGLKTNPHSHENRRRLARLLAGNARTIEQAVDEYNILVKDKPRDAGIRTEYARLLGARFETIDQAIEQYQILTEQHPKNSAAHRELAAAYAWQGDQDRALYHSQLALRYDSRDKNADRIRDDLMQGREPMIRTGLAYLNQSGNDSRYDYSGFLLKAGGKTDITPFATLDAEIGLEQYQHHETEVEGTFYKLSVQGRFDRAHRADLEWKYHAFDAAEADSEFLARYSARSGGFVIEPGVRREFKYDSLLSLAGDRDPVSGRKIGAARANTAFCRFAFEDERIEVSAMPYFGSVTADSADNGLAGADADARFPFFDNGTLALSLWYKFQIYHYQKDASGFAGNTNAVAGGYFSPDLFVNNALNLNINYQIRQDSSLLVSAGPSFQNWQGHSDEDERNTGVDVDLTFHMKITESLHLMADGSYYQIAKVYRRRALTALLAYTF
jgi:tetratricopeptide (TPR) repeat protein